MPVDPNRQRVAIRYQADDGLFYSIVTSRNHAVAVNATGALPTDPPFPIKWKPRHVNGRQILGGRDRGISLVVPLKSSALWQQTQQVVGVQPYGNFTVTGETGERRSQAAPGFDGNANPPQERVTIKYTDDNGRNWAILTNRAHAAAVQALDGSTFPSFPEIWTPRHINVTNENLTGADQKKVLVAPDPTKPFWLADGTFVFQIEGVPYDSTGRADEDKPRGAPPFVP